MTQGCSTASAESASPAQTRSTETTRIYTLADVESGGLLLSTAVVACSAATPSSGQTDDTQTALASLASRYLTGTAPYGGPVDEVAGAIQVTAASLTGPADLEVSFVGARTDAGAPCGYDYIARAAESDSTVAVYIGSHPARPSARTPRARLTAKYGDGTLHLTTPLGYRQLIDVATITLSP